MTRRILQLTAYMPYGMALIAYRKQNGRGTLIHYKADFHRKYDIEHIQNHVVYWDIEQQGINSFPDRELPGMETGGKLKIES